MGVQDAFAKGMIAETLLAKAEEVLGVVPAFPGSRTGGQALAGRRQDFGADALRHGEYPCFGAGPAPHSRVGWLPLLLLSRRVSARSQRSWAREGRKVCMSRCAARNAEYRSRCTG